ncbi:MAG: urease accessory protein UreE [Alistipes sp.]|nr:urease accessory protein UreE [Alistipes sp.]
MKVYNEILGNIADERWRERVALSTVEYIDLDQWTAQKSRFVARSDRGREYAVSLRRHSRLSDGDIICYRADEGEMVVVRLRMSDVMVIDLGALLQQPVQTAVHIAVELGHALGNQHWPAVVQESRVYVPLTVDRKVMASVMRTHHIEHIAYSFRSADQIIPYLSPHEVRRLMGGAHDHHHTHG